VPFRLSRFRHAAPARLWPQQRTHHRPGRSLRRPAFRVMGGVNRFPRGKQVARSPIRRALFGRGRSGTRSPSQAIAGAQVRGCGARRRRRWVSIPDSMQYLHRFYQTPEGVARWQRHASWRHDSTGCGAPRPGIRRWLASRAARGCPGWAQARSQIRIGRCPIPRGAGCSHRTIMAETVAESGGWNRVPPQHDERQIPGP
jgi:hypothetical protein